MAEAAAAFYAVETVIEGAAVGAIAVSQSTVPLHLRFRDLGEPPSSLAWNPTAVHSLDVVKGKAYVFGGDVSGREPDTNIRIVTLPSDIENGEPDYQVVEPQIETNRPLQAYAASSETSEKLTAPSGLEIKPRACHVSTTIGTDIFILTGRTPKSINTTDPSPELSEIHFYGCDHIYSFSTQTNTWSIIEADVTKCKDGLPPPRINASCTSSPHPQPDAIVEATIHSHGTIFLHGGYNQSQEFFRDTWTFDVSSRIWTRWPDLPDPMAEEIAGEGRVACVGKRLWRAGDGFGKMMFMDLEIAQGDVVGEKSGPYLGETGIKPTSNRWIAVSAGEKAADTALQGEIGAGSEKKLINKSEILPVPRQGAGFLPITTGAGRQYLLYFMGQDGPGSMLNDVWTFQIQSDDKSPATVKDAVRHAVGKETGENEWAKCEIVESTKKEGLLDLPHGLAGFAADSWTDLGGGNLVLWGGVDASGSIKSQCWIMSVQ